MPIENNITIWTQAIAQEPLYPNLIAQIQKDFDLTGVYIDLPENASPEQLINTVSQVVYSLVQYKFDTFMQLLYRIDVAEQIMQTDSVDTAEVVTEKATYEILKREWQKVQWREKFS